MRLPGGAKRDLAELEAQLQAATAEQDAAKLAVEQAKAAKNEVDATDRAAWEQVERNLASARSEHERCDRAVSVAYRRCADLAEEIAAAKEAKVVADLAAVTSRIAGLEQQLADARGEEQTAEDRLEDARAETAASRVPYLAPGSAERQAHEGRERQRRETLYWHARHPDRDHVLSRRDLAEALRIRTEGVREAHERHERAIAAGVARGDFVVVENLPA